MARPSRPSLLAVLGHPDDEALLAGGVLAQHAAAGADTAVVTATWASGTHRATELADALTVLGAGELRMLGYADARVPESAPGRPRLCDAPIDELVEAVDSHIRAVRPQILITHDAYGQLTGFPVKLMCSSFEFPHRWPTAPVTTRGVRPRRACVPRERCGGGSGEEDIPPPFI